MIPGTMQRVHFAGGSRAALQQVNTPSPSGDEVVVRVRASALCGSDLRELYRPEKGSLLTPGHEVAGDVVATDRAKPPTCRRSSRALLLDRVRPMFALSPGCVEHVPLINNTWLFTRWG